MPSIRTISRVAIASAALLAGACERPPGDTLDVTGQIEAGTVVAGSRIGGRVTAVHVTEGDAVRSGDPLFDLDAREAEAAVNAAGAKLQQAEATLEKLVNGPRPQELRRAEAALEAANQSYLMAVNGARSQEIKAARAEADAARAQRDQAKIEYERVKNLLAEGATSQQRFDAATHQYEQAQNIYEANLEKLDLLVEGTRDEQTAIALAERNRAQAALDELLAGTRKEDIAAARAARDALEAELERARVALDEMRVVAPADGVVQLVDIDPGDLVQSGGVVGIADPEALELVVYVSARYLGRFNVGQQVELSTDSHGDERFPARITYIAPEGEYTPRNLQTEEERVQQVFGVKLELDSQGGRLRAGMTATVHLPLSGGNRE